MDQVRQAQDAYIADIADMLRQIPDPVERIRAVNKAISHGGLGHSTWARITRETVNQLLADRTQTEVARMLGISEVRVKKLKEETPASGSCPGAEMG